MSLQRHPTRVAHLTTVHNPRDVRIFHKECRTLATAGYEVTLVAPHDRDEVIAGVRIKAVRKPRGRVGRFSRTVRAVYRAARDIQADIYHLHDPELLPVGALLKIHGSRVIYDAHEDYPRQILNKYWIPGPLRWAVGKAVGLVEATASFFFDGFVAASPEIAKRFPAAKTALVQNFPRLEELALSTPPTDTAGPATILYVGLLAPVRGVMEMIRAMEHIPQDLSCVLALAGEYQSPVVKEEARRLSGWSSVRYLGYVDRHQLASELARARVGLCVSHNTPQYYHEPYQTKMFEYMAARLPIIVSHFQPWRDVLEPVGCALFVDPEDVKEIADAITWVLNHPTEAAAMGQRGRDAVLARWNWDREGEKLCALYRGLVP